MTIKPHDIVEDYLNATRLLRVESFFLEELHTTARAMNARLSQTNQNQLDIVAVATAQKYSEVIFVDNRSIVIVDAQQLYFFLALNYNYLSEEPDRLRVLFLSEVVECLCWHRQYDIAANLLDYLRRTDRTSLTLNPDIQLVAKRITNLQSAFVISHEFAHIMLRSEADSERVIELRAQFFALHQGLTANAKSENKNIKTAIQELRKQSKRIDEDSIRLACGLVTSTYAITESMVEALRSTVAIHDKIANLPTDLEEEILCDMHATSALIWQYGSSDETLIYAVRAAYLAIVGIISLKYIKAYVQQIHDIELWEIWRHNDLESIIRLTFATSHIDCVLQALPLSERAITAARHMLSQLSEEELGWTKILDVDDQQSVKEIVSRAPPDAPEEDVKDLMVDILLRGLN